MKGFSVNGLCRNCGVYSRWQSLTLGGTRDPTAGRCETGLELQRTGIQANTQTRGQALGRGTWQGSPRSSAERVSPGPARERMELTVQSGCLCPGAQIPGAYTPARVSRSQSLSAGNVHVVHSSGWKIVTVSKDHSPWRILDL